jgi:hypothetical protein
VEVVFRGHVSARVVDWVVEHVEQQRTPRFFLFDATDVAGYDANVRVPGVRLLEILKKRGAVAGVTVASSPTIRMIGAALAFVAALPVEFVATRNEGLERLARRRDANG